MRDGLTLVRMPTYRRPELLARALNSLRAQTITNWRCIVYDDSPDELSKGVCEAFQDERIVHVFNAPRKFAAANIDQCFARSDEADYFFVLEDDNFVLPSFIEDNIATLRERGVSIVLRNQYIAPVDINIDALGACPTILHSRFQECVYAADEFVCSGMFSMGVSNGGLFWTRGARTDLEIRAPQCSAVLHEHLRTILIRDPVYVALKPLAIWSDNGEDTTRHSGGDLAFVRRELNLKQSFNVMRRRIARALQQRGRYDLVQSDIYLTSMHQRQLDIAKALLPWPGRGGLSLAQRVNMTARGITLSLLGRPASDLPDVLDRLDLS
jgi:glycosyltransferase involved in cell wall biosynthesis